MAPGSSGAMPFSMIPSTPAGLTYCCLCNTEGVFRTDTPDANLEVEFDNDTFIVTAECMHGFICPSCKAPSLLAVADQEFTMKVRDCDGLEGLSDSQIAKIAQMLHEDGIGISSKQHTPCFKALPQFNEVTCTWDVLFTCPGKSLYITHDICGSFKVDAVFEFTIKDYDNDR